MSRQPRSRRTRRQAASTQPEKFDPKELDLPGPLRILTNPKLFIAFGVIFIAGIVFSLFAGIFSTSATPDSRTLKAMNEVPDAPLESTTPTGSATPASTAVIKRYTAAPPLTVNTSATYQATLKTTKGDIVIELYPSQAPEAVNAFLFLAGDGYYNNTPFMQVTSNPDGSRFTAQAGDPTRTGNGTPGFNVKQDLTSLPFTKGAVGYDKGQFFISYGDYPALTTKSTIFGKVISGQDVLDRLSLLKPTDRSTTGDEIQSITIASPQ